MRGDYPDLKPQTRRPEPQRYSEDGTLLSSRAEQISLANRIRVKWIISPLGHPGPPMYVYFSPPFYEFAKANGWDMTFVRKQELIPNVKQ